MYLKKVVFLLFPISVFGLNLNDVKKLNYYNLTTQNSQNYVYLIDYNQKNSLVYELENSQDILNFNENINIRYIPSPTTNIQICFNLKKNILEINKDTINCLKINESVNYASNDMPIAIFSDGAVVKNASKLNSKLVNEYFETLEKEKINKINLEFNEHLIYYNSVFNDRILVYNNFINKYPNESYSKILNTIKNIQDNKDYANKIKFVPTKIKIEKRYIFQKNNKCFKEINLFIDQFKRMSLNNTLFNFYNEDYIYLNNQIVLKERGLKSIIKPPLYKYKSNKIERLSDGNTIFINNKPRVKKVDFNKSIMKGVIFQKHSIPEVDPEIQITNN